MKEQFVTYEIALKLKEFGFNEECFGCWESNTKFHIPFIVGQDLEKPNHFNEQDNCVAAALWQQAMTFILKEYGLSIEFNVCNDAKFHYEIFSHNNDDYGYSVCVESDQYSPMPLSEARQNAILKALEICKTKLSPNNIENDDKTYHQKQIETVINKVYTSNEDITPNDYIVVYNREDNSYILDIVEIATTLPRALHVKNDYVSGEVETNMNVNNIHICKLLDSDKSIVEELINCNIIKNDEELSK